MSKYMLIISLIPPIPIAKITLYFKFSYSLLQSDWFWYFQWQFWHLGWHFWLLTLHRHPPLVSPGPLGPQRGPLVTQQISVWQTVQRSQSHPSLFCTMMPHWGQCMASPDCTRVFSRCVVLLAAESFIARAARSSWYCLQFIPSWIDLQIRQLCFLQTGQWKTLTVSSYTHQPRQSGVAQW